MDIATLIGIIAGAAVFIFGVASGDYGFTGLKYFFDKPSLIMRYADISIIFLYTTGFLRWVKEY